jgi:hypothetical protein
MSFSLLPLDIVRIIIWKCDILSLLRLERVCKILKGFINNNEFWSNKFKRIDCYWLVNISQDNKTRMIINEIRNRRTKLIKKYRDIINEEFKDESATLTERKQYKYLYKKYPEDDIVRDIRILYKNLQLKRIRYPIEKNLCISVYGKSIDIAIKENKNIKFNTIVALFGNKKDSAPKYLLIKLNAYVKGEVAWARIPETKMENWLLKLKDELCISKEDFQKLYNFPFLLGEAFDYL